MRGLFQSDRGNMLRMSEVNAADHQAMQHMLTSECVDWAGLQAVVAADANALLGGDDAVFILDESGFAKKGEASAGVARQWNGRLGKVDNSQVGVFAALCRGEMSCLIDGRLYLPQSWVSDPERCKQAAIPKAEQRYRAKSELALEMVDEADRRGVRYGDIAVDGGYGKEPAFLRGLDRRGKRFVADVHKDQRVYLKDPLLHLPEGAGRGRRPTRLVTTGVPVRVDAWAAAQPASSWQRLVLREGEKGLIAAEYLHARVWVWDGEEAMAHCWHLMVRREVGRVRCRTIACRTHWRRPNSRPWCGYRHNASSSSIASGKRRASAAWPTIRYGAGMPGTTTWPWSCWRRCSWSSRKWPIAKPGPCSRSTIWSPPSPICCRGGR